VRSHFEEFYAMLVENRLIPEAALASSGGVKSYLSGISDSAYNIAFGKPQSTAWETAVDATCHRFQEAEVPFLWCIDADEDPSFQESLLDRGFKTSGLFQGVIGALPLSMGEPRLPEGYSLEIVQDLSTMEEFLDLFFNLFHMAPSSRDLLRTCFWNQTKGQESHMVHWLARRRGTPVAILSTWIKGNTVSFWNGASLPEVRRQGVCTALGHAALRDAISKGCRLGASYLMPSALALSLFDVLLPLKEEDSFLPSR
jgi:hypothetical protein